jgi:hypothetical protein
MIPDLVEQWNSSCRTRQEAREARLRYAKDPDHPNAAAVLRITEHLYSTTEHELNCWRETLGQLREVWMWLERAVAAEMPRAGAELLRSDRAAWAALPDPGVLDWLKAVHDLAVRGAADARAGVMRFERPVALTWVAKQVGRRIDLVRPLLERSDMPIGGTQRKPVAELEDVVNCFPEHVDELRRLAAQPRRTSHV